MKTLYLQLYYKGRKKANKTVPKKLVTDGSSLEMCIFLFYVNCLYGAKNRLWEETRTTCIYTVSSIKYGYVSKANMLVLYKGRKSCLAQTKTGHTIQLFLEDSVEMKGSSWFSNVLQEGIYIEVWVVALQHICFPVGMIIAGTAEVFISCNNIDTDEGSNLFLKGRIVLSN